MSFLQSLLDNSTFCSSLIILLFGFVLIVAYWNCCVDMNHDALAPDIEQGLPTNLEPNRNNVEIIYKRKKSGGDNGVVVTEDCCICLEEFNDGESCTVLSCNHTYHRACIKVWLRINKHCPICRDSVRGKFIKDDDSSTMQPNLGIG